MKRSSTPGALLLIAISSGCLAPQSTFAFDLRGDTVQRVRSGVDVPGEIDNDGYLSIDDSAWGVRMSLGGLAPGNRTITNGTGELVLLSKSSGDVFSTSVAGTCSVWLDPHESTNGSTITGLFTCTGLGASGGKSIDVTGGRFGTFLTDAANDPHVSPPTPSG